MSFFKKYFIQCCREEVGSVILLFAIGLVLLGAFMGAMVDYSRASSARSRLQSATDALALTYSRDMKQGSYVAAGTGGAALASKSFFAADFLKNDYAEYAWWSWVGEADTSTNRYNVTSRAGIKTSFLNLIRISEIEISVTSTSSFAQSTIELALVLDTTGSMSEGGRMDGLKAAMLNFIDLIERKYGSNNNILKVSVVPFSQLVRVDVANRNETWINQNRIDMNLWTGCIYDRRDPYDISNFIPTTSMLASLYDPVTTTSTGGCADGRIATMLPLTNDYNLVRSKISSLPTEFRTNIPQGLIWGWNMLSPGRPLSNASSKSDVQRFLILITDGVNTDDRVGGNGKEDPSLNPDIYRIDGRTERSCDEIKSNGITIFTFRVIEGNENLLRGCASKPSYFYDIYDPRDLKKALENVNFTISKMRLSN